MLRKITSILILLSFFLLRGTSVYSSDWDKSAGLHYASDQESEESPTADKSGKCGESDDDDFLPTYAFDLLPLEISKRINFSAALHMLPIYISSVNPPPDSGLYFG